MPNLHVFYGLENAITICCTASDDDVVLDSYFTMHNIWWPPCRIKKCQWLAARSWHNAKASYTEILALDTVYIQQYNNAYIVACGVWTTSNYL
jgi:hypothetical protein